MVRSIELLVKWMDCGMEICSRIDALKEVQDKLPEQKTQELLSDEIKKLLEDKKK